MHIDVISSPEELERLRDNWDRLYEADPEAQFFVSWTWLARYIRQYDGTWFILAARQETEGSPYVALMPLRMRTRMNGRSGHFFNEINMAGNYTADYSGVICAPEFADQAIAAFATHLNQMSWTRIHLENLRMSDERLRIFLRHFSRETFSLRLLSRVNLPENIDNCRCLSIALPDSWDGYLENKLGSSTRQKIRRFLRKADDGADLRVTHADASTVDADIDMLLEFWRLKWGARKGKRLAPLLAYNRRMLRQNFEIGALFLPVLRQGDRSLGGMATFMDPAKRSMLFFMAGRDDTVTTIPTGVILHAHSIRWGIENGFRTYDFLRGDEPYKFSFGVDETAVRCAMIHTRSGRNLHGRLDPRTLDAVFLRVTRFHAAGELKRAENGYRQILRADPAYSRALYGLGQLLDAKGDHGEAVETYLTLSKIVPNSAKVWYRLGSAYQMLGHHEEAVAAFRQALEKTPDLTAAQFELGRSLAVLKQIGEAAAMFANIQQKEPIRPIEQVIQAKAGELLQMLRRDSQPAHIMRNRPNNPASAIASQAY